VRTIQTHVFRRRTCAPVSHSSSATKRSAGELEHCATQHVLAIRLNPETKSRTLDALGIDSELGERSQDRLQDDQREGRNHWHGTVISINPLTSGAA
jgi:hypothetical protein